MILQQTSDNALLFQSTQSLHCESAIVPVHSDSANGNILLLTNIVYVINKKIYCHFNSFVLCYHFQIRHASEQSLLNVQTAKF